MALKTLKRHQSRQLLHLAELMKKAGTDRERMKLKPLVTVEVHNRDVHVRDKFRYAMLSLLNYREMKRRLLLLHLYFIVRVQEKLMQSRCDSEHHFSWTSQLRMELREDIHEADKSDHHLGKSPLQYSLLYGDYLVTGTISRGSLLHSSSPMCLSN